jgi:hypothetical protein
LSSKIIYQDADTAIGLNPAFIFSPINGSNLIARQNKLALVGNIYLCFAALINISVQHR